MPQAITISIEAATLGALVSFVVLFATVYGILRHLMRSIVEPLKIQMESLKDSIAEVEESLSEHRNGEDGRLSGARDALSQKIQETNDKLTRLNDRTSNEFQLVRREFKEADELIKNDSERARNMLRAEYIVHVERISGQIDNLVARLDRVLESNQHSS